MTTLLRKKETMNTNSYPALDLFAELLVPSLSGSEETIAGIIQKKLSDLDFDPITDPAGNIQVHLLGKDRQAPLFVFAAHMDEIGMVVTRIETGGRLLVTSSGGLYPWKLGEGAVDVFGDKTILQGVLSMGSTHTQDADKKTAVSWNDVHILTGLSTQELRSAGVRSGSAVLPVRERRGPVVFGPKDDPLVGAWTFDDRMGCATLIRLLESIKQSGIQPHHPTVIAFTTQEEIGGHGAKYLARTINPEFFVAVDGCPILANSPLSMDGRPGIWAKDKLAQYDQSLIRSFYKAATAAGTGLQAAVYDDSASDASLASYALGIPKIACIGHVRENSHGFEVARLSVFDNLLNTLTTFVKSFPFA